MLRFMPSRTFRCCLAFVALSSLSTAAVALAHGDHGRHGFGFGQHRNYVATGWVQASPNVTTLTVRDFGGSLHSFAVNSSTKYAYANGTSATAADATPNTVVTVRGTAPATSGGNPVAQQVVIALAQISGEVTSNSGGKIILADEQGFMRTVNTSGTTKCTQNYSKVSCASLSTGSVVVAVGTVDPYKTSLDAVRVTSHTSS